MLGTYIYVNLKRPYRLTHLIIILWKVLLAVYKLLRQLTSQEAMSTLYNPAVSPATYRLQHAPCGHTHYSHDHTLQRSEPAFAASGSWLKQDPIHRALLGWLQLVLEEV